MHRDGTFDDDWDRVSTASNPVGIEKENGSYVRHTIRRTSSADDVSRYHRYFKLLQELHGKRFTWICYADILYETVCHYKTPDVPGKTLKRSSSLYVTASETSMAPEKKMQFQRRAVKYRRKDFISHKSKRSSRSGASVYIPASEGTSWALEQETRLEKLSITRRCRDLITRASPSSKRSPLSPSSSKKLSGENKSLVRDISQTIDRISKMARKKSDKRMKHLVRTISRNGYTPVSSGYSSSEKVAVTTSSGSVASVSTPLSASSDGKRARTRKKKNDRLAYASLTPLA